MNWTNPYGDIITEKDREDFIGEEMANDENASGIVGDRANSERVFNQQHVVLTNSEAGGSMRTDGATRVVCSNTITFGGPVRIHCQTWNHFYCRMQGLGVLYADPIETLRGFRAAGVIVQREEILDTSGHCVWTLAKAPAKRRKR